MNQIHKYWSGILVRGIIALLFGLIAIFMPSLTLQVLVVIFGAFCFIDGIIAFFVGMFSKSFEMMLEGLVGVLIGLFIFFFTPLAIYLFAIIVAVWAIVTGVIEIIAGLSIRQYIANEIWLMLVGILSIFFGIVIFFYPLVSAVAVTFIIGVYALVLGVFMIALALKVKSSGGKKKK